MQRIWIYFRNVQWFSTWTTYYYRWVWLGWDVKVYHPPPCRQHLRKASSSLDLRSVVCGCVCLSYSCSLLFAWATQILGNIYPNFLYKHPLLLVLLHGSRSIHPHSVTNSLLVHVHQLFLSALLLLVLPAGMFCYCCWCNWFRCGHQQKEEWTRSSSYIPR